MGFLHYVLERIGFTLKWRMWISFVFFPAYLSVLVNGFPSSFLQSSCDMGLCCVFLCFEALSWLRVNLVVSELILVGYFSHADYLASILGV